MPTGLARSIGCRRHCRYANRDVLLMATVCAETIIDAPADRVWDVVADVGAVHQRLLPGRVAEARIEGDVRVLTMPDGAQVRELILAVDHSIRRMAYTVTEGRRLPLTYHHASFQVFEEGGRSRLVWLTDVLPHALADVVKGRVERGIQEIKEILERTEAAQ
jgi:hypothetical protein